MEYVVALIALTTMEIVLGIDNIVFIALLAGRLPKDQQQKARTLGLAVALVTRIGLLLCLKWILGLTSPLFHLSDFLPDGVLEALHYNPDAAAADGGEHGSRWASVDGVSIRDLILLAGGLFLLCKSVLEIHHKIEGDETRSTSKPASFAGVIAQIAVLDIVFSLDSVITAIGMVKPEDLWVMIVAIVLAVGVMLVFAGKISRFIEQHPTLKMLALSFLILIGVLLVAEGLGTHINKGYIYFAMAFSLIVEILNMRMRRRQTNSHVPAH